MTKGSKNLKKQPTLSVTRGILRKQRKEHNKTEKDNEVAAVGYSFASSPKGFSSSVAPNPFGTSAFGKAPTTVFGQPSTAFGATTAPLFGQANNQHGSMFSSATPSSFGQAVTPQPTFGTGMFGSTPAQPSSSGLFGAGSTASFGQPAKTPSFGFGSNTASTGFFGQPQASVQPTAQASGLFGQSNTNLFGSNTAFGTSTSNTQIGTAVKFAPVTGTDTMIKGSINQTISTRHHCITCMKEYEGKSLEELRWEDYQVNRKGPQQGAQPTAGLFGNMAQPVGGGLFGSNPVATSSSTLFGQPDNKVFGSTSTTGFGQTNTFGQTASTTSIPGGLFGKPITGFGASTSTTSTFPFSSTAQPAPLFGTATQTKAFGVQPQQPSIFGQTPGFAQSSFGGFGTPQNQNVGLFNQNKSAPFNLATSSTTSFGSFGQPPQLQNTSLFSGAKTNTGFGGFGVTTTAPVFGQSSFGQTQSGGLFNTSFIKAPAPLFGSSSSTSSLGGTNSGMSLGSSPSLFNTSLNKSSTMFGQNVGMFNTGFSNSSTTIPFNMGGTMTQQGATAADQSQAQAEQQIISMSATPYGLPQLLSNISELDVDVKDTSRATNPTELNALLNSVNKCQTSPPSEKLNPVQVYGRKTPMFDGLEHRDESLLSNVRLKNNPKRLVIRNKSIRGILEPPTNIQPTQILEMTFPHASRSRDFPDDCSMPTVSSDLSLKSVLDSPKSSKTNLMIEKPTSKSTPAFETKTSKVLVNKPTSHSDTTMGSPMVSTILEDATHLEESVSGAKDDEVETFTEAAESQEWDSDFLGLVEKPTTISMSLSDTIQELNTTPIVHPTGIILTRPEYYTVPALNELVISEDGTCVVQGFTVGRLGYGNVSFPEAIDVSNINLDELVHFRHKEITIYPDDTKKPPVGQGLNRRAQITLDKVWPMDKKAKQHVTDVESLMKIDYAGKLRRLCDKQNTRFVEYRPDTGSWVFKVDHFSKYGHPDSDDEEDEEEGEKKEPEKPNQLKTLKLKQTLKAPDTQEQTPPEEPEEPEHTLLSRPDEPMPYAGDDAMSKPSKGLRQNIKLRENINFGDLVADEVDRHYIGVDYNIISPPADCAKYSLMKSAFFEGIVPDYDDSASALIYVAPQT